MGSVLAAGIPRDYMHTNSGLNGLTIINADELRALEGVNISRALSWERTSKDSWRAIRTLDQFSPCPLLITLFGADGAILFRNEFDQEPEAVLVFDPLRLEGDFNSKRDLDKRGDSAKFAEAFSRHIAQHGADRLLAGIAAGLTAARRHSGEEEKEYDWAVCEIEPAAYGDDPDPSYWRILDQQTRNTRLLVAEQTVLNGVAEGLTNVPRARFGALETIDRAEIESYGAIRELISEYIEQRDPPRPLCIAVFGPPGAGKSFGVKQVMKSIQADNVVSKTFNMSSYSHYDELTKALHEVKDTGAEGQLPFIFFDEFDSPLKGHRLGWLASFLAPMNDGEFKDGDTVYAIGKAIFVFAGGTAATLAQFSRFDDEDFVKVKGPDFVSRLRGFVNVMGPNRQSEMDDAYLLRRALVLRSNFVRNAKAQCIVERASVNVDPSVLRAMLHITTYKHGMRSMDALLDMSTLGLQNRFNLTALPPKAQLDLHVDAQEFIWLTQCERYQTMIPQNQWPKTDAANRLATESAFVELLAEQVFRNVVRNRRLEVREIRLPDSWGALANAEKQSFRDSAIDIPAKLRAVNHGIRKIPEEHSANIPDISDIEIHALAKLEHSRRCRYLRLNGYRYGEKTDKPARRSSRLVPFEEMPLDRIDHYIQGIYAIPVVLQALGYEIFRMEEHSIFTDLHLLELLARLVHEDYVRNAGSSGKIAEANDSLLPYDELPADKIESNLDNAASIPKKLRRIGYRMVKQRPDDTSPMLVLTESQILELAQMEHSRWVWQSLMHGWSYQPGTKDAVKKTNPCILPWNQLDDATRQLDIDTVKLIPDLLARAHYKVVR